MVLVNQEKLRIFFAQVNKTLGKTAFRKYPKNRLIAFPYLLDFARSLHLIAESKKDRRIHRLNLMCIMVTFAQKYLGRAIMEKRKPNDLSPDQCLAVDTESLCKLLDCGRHTAVQIGDLAHARITMNSRVLWSVQRVKEYLYEISC